MRWALVWLLLTGVYLAGQLAACLFAGRFDYGREDLLHLAAVPLAQVVALWTVATVRRNSRRPRPGRPPRADVSAPAPAPGTDASRPAAEP